MQDIGQHPLQQSMMRLIAKAGDASPDALQAAVCMCGGGQPGKYLAKFSLSMQRIELQRRQSGGRAAGDDFFNNGGNCPACLCSTGVDAQTQPGKPCSSQRPPGSPQGRSRPRW